MAQLGDARHAGGLELACAAGLVFLNCLREELLEEQWLCKSSSWLPGAPTLHCAQSHLGRLDGEVTGEKLDPLRFSPDWSWTGFSRGSVLCHRAGDACRSVRLDGFGDGLSAGGSHPAWGMLGTCRCPVEDHVLVEA